jgi:hypothetical protein
MVSIQLKSTLEQLESQDPETPQVRRHTPTADGIDDVVRI